MTRLKKRAGGQAVQGLTPLTMLLIASGFVIFYFGSQAVTSADAHLLHWGLAAAGGGLGWLVGTLAERLRGE